MVCPDQQLQNPRSIFGGIWTAAWLLQTSLAACRPSWLRRATATPGRRAESAAEAPCGSSNCPPLPRHPCRLQARPRLPANCSQQTDQGLEYPEGHLSPPSAHPPCISLSPAGPRCHSVASPFPASATAAANLPAWAEERPPESARLDAH
jgi:hypothetical protein